MCISTNIVIAMVTPHEEYPKLAEALELSSVYFKREDLHPLGSHKGRSISVMIDEYVAEGKHAFAISSSGNAALAAALHIKELNDSGAGLTLDVYIGRSINPQKHKELKFLADEAIVITQTERPLQTLFNATEGGSIQALRQSKDDLALRGYEALANELIMIKDIAAVFIPTSSGTTAEALALAFKSAGKNVEIHVVQTSSCHPIAEAFEGEYESDEKSIADAIVDHTALRRPKLVPLIEESNGFGYTATNEEIKSAIEIAEKNTGLTLSPNSALSVAGLMKAVYTGRKFNGAVVCLITGR
jgi:threonine dehydratase